MRVLVGGHTQFAAGHGGQHDIVAAVHADEEGVGAGPRAILAVLLGGGEIDDADFAMRGRAGSELADEERVQTLQAHR